MSTGCPRRDSKEARAWSRGTEVSSAEGAAPNQAPQLGTSFALTGHPPGAGVVPVGADGTTVAVADPVTVGLGGVVGRGGLVGAAVGFVEVAVGTTTGG